MFYTRLLVFRNVVQLAEIPMGREHPMFDEATQEVPITAETVAVEINKLIHSGRNGRPREDIEVHVMGHPTWEGTWTPGHRDPEDVILFVARSE